ncbi:MAG: DUF1146 family protein [Bacilli bacterium]
MNYKVYIYIICFLLTSFALSGLNFDNFMKKNKTTEARVLVILLTCAIGYLATNFIIDFIEVSKIL